MEIKGDFENTAFKFEGNEFPAALSSYIEEDYLYNQKSLLFFEERYISEVQHFSKIVDKYKLKVFDNQTKIFKNGKLENLIDYSDEVELYSQVIADNNINGLDRYNLNISIKHFSNYEQSNKLKFIQNIYILLFLSNTTEYKNDNFVFRIKSDEKDVTKSLDFKNIETEDLIIFYEWITSSKENLLTRLRIIREIVLHKGSFGLEDSDLESAKSLFNRIISEETDKYFSQINSLKDDFLKLTERQKDSLSALHLKVLGWASAIALFIYDALKDQQNEGIIHKLFLSVTEKTKLFLVIFLLAIVFIWIIFINEMREHKNEYKKIKDFYTKQLFFEEKDFKNYLEKPKITHLYKGIFIGIIIVLILRFFINDILDCIKLVMR
jgi:hypothetical protein